MAKRFTDTDKWKRPWFVSLDLCARFTWLYLLDSCDNRGVWIANFKLASFQLDFEINDEKLVGWFGDKLIRIADDKFFIPSFVEFQYGKLNPNNNAHKPVIDLLASLRTLGGPGKDLGRTRQGPLRGAQDKEKEKDKDKDKDKERAPIAAPPGYASFSDRFDPEKQQLLANASEAVSAILGAPLSPGWRNLIPTMLRNVNWDRDEFTRLLSKLGESFCAREVAPSLDYREVAIKREFGLIHQVAP